MFLARIGKCIKFLSVPQVLLTMVSPTTVVHNNNKPTLENVLSRFGLRHHHHQTVSQLKLRLLLLVYFYRLRCLSSSLLLLLHFLRLLLHVIVR